ncbi:hypothetical protein SDC9_100305 [bioreactor metagenome]|uniref:Uncharacterized protein n=1 Tax=bioreactor metagenome TaxID=1076179 RepID=A0A645AKH0_9ZZZZ
MVPAAEKLAQVIQVGTKQRWVVLSACLFHHFRIEGKLFDQLTLITEAQQAAVECSLMEVLVV